MLDIFFMSFFFVVTNIALASLVKTVIYVLLATGTRDIQQTELPYIPFAVHLFQLIAGADG